MILVSWGSAVSPPSWFPEQSLPVVWAQNQPQCRQMPGLQCSGTGGRRKKAWTPAACGCLGPHRRAYNLDGQEQTQLPFPRQGPVSLGSPASPTHPGACTGSSLLPCWACPNKATKDRPVP